MVTIYLIYNLIKISKQVKQVTDSAEKAVHNIAKTSNFVKSSTSKAAMGTLITGFFDSALSKARAKNAEHVDNTTKTNKKKKK